ncbi:MAG: PQQ-binding-like beta-propeller repeat protein [Actinomycetota bacterium]
MSRRAARPLLVSLLAAALIAGSTSGAATAAQLDPAWSQAYDGPGTKDDVPRAQELSPDGSLVVTTGESATPRARTNAVTIAHDATSGAVVWTAIENDGPDDGMFDVAFDPAGRRVYVTGRDGVDAGPSDDALVVAYDATTGARLWKTSLQVPQDRVQTTMIAVSPSGGRVVVAGRTWTAPVRTYVAGLDAAAGTPVWESFEGDAPGEGFRPIPVDLVFDPAGNAVTAATALSRTGIGGDVHVVSYRGPTGQARWATTYDGPAEGPDLAAELAVAPTALFLVGSSERTGNRSDVLALSLALDDGQIAWDAHWNGDGDGFDDGSSIAVRRDGGRLFLAGSTQRTGTDTHEDYVVLARRASDGAGVWERTYDGPAHAVDVARQIARAEDGTLVVTGTSAGKGGDADVMTLAFDPSGLLRWKDRSGDPTGDDGGVGVTAGATLAFVTGWFARPPPIGQDIVVSAYPLAG